ncbi:1-deoxy-D-xylulose-5-phosphate reductoisomerase [Pelagibacteraceae bacterium]|nr:1-deoxy-D-xylulose-5-phosphate reductoisomerase [Pelagibacteraceae bacterium]
MKLQTVALLGSTGSIGQSTLEIVKKTKKFKVVLIFANTNYFKILSQIKIFKPKIVIVNNFQVYLKIKKIKKFKKLIILNNIANIKKYLKKVDITISAVPGIAGLEPTLTFIKLSKKILLANKESIVCGWSLIKKTMKKYNTNLVPIDSEHFSILELTKLHTNDEIEKIFITASGGPFLKLDKRKFKNIKPKDAIKHPKWKMGKKISVDSATLMNKVLELTEALKLFPFDLKKYEIIIHPQSLVHAIVKFKNGTTYLLYHLPDMKIPIANAMFNKNFLYEKYFNKKINIKGFSNQNLEFLPVDKNKFSTLKLISKINSSKSGPIIINAANEIFVDEFLKHKITFNNISEYLNLVLKDKNYIKTSNMTSNSLKSIYKIDTWGRYLAHKIIKKRKQY